MLRKRQGVGKPSEMMWYLRASLTTPKPEGKKEREQLLKPRERGGHGADQLTGAVTFIWTGQDMAGPR